MCCTCCSFSSLKTFSFFFILINSWATILMPLSISVANLWSELRESLYSLPLSCMPSISLDYCVLNHSNALNLTFGDRLVKNSIMLIIESRAKLRSATTLNTFNVLKSSFDIRLKLDATSCPLSLLMCDIFLELGLSDFIFD